MIRCPLLPGSQNKLVFILALNLLFCSQLSLATNLSDAYAAAVANDPVLGAARAQLDANEEAIPQTRSLLLPNVGIGGSTSWNEQKFPGSGVSKLEFNQHQWRASLSQPVLNMQSWYTYTSAKAAVDAARMSYATTDQNLIVRTVNAYLDVLRVDARLQAARAAESAVQRQLEQVQQRFDVGLVAITDVLEAQAAYDNSVVVVVQAVGDHDIFFEVLRTLTRQPYNEIDDLSEKLPIVNPDPVNEEAWVAAALATNYVIKAAEAQLTAAQRTVKARRSGHLPTIDGTISSGTFKTGGPSFFSKSESTVYGLTATLPIYQGGFISSRTKEAQALAEQSRQLLLDSRLSVSRDTRNLFIRVATDVVRVRARLKAITSAESALEATTTGYEVGTRNIVDVLRSQENLFSSQFDFADSRYNYVLSLILLKQRVGVLDEEDITQLNAFTDTSLPVTRLATLKTRTVN